MTTTTTPPALQPGGGTLTHPWCEFCRDQPGTLVAIDDPEHLPAELRQDRHAARVTCPACDDGAWSRVYPLPEGFTLAGARSWGLARRARDLRGEGE